jgi:putative tricarboxylic transport membrane protein
MIICLNIFLLIFAYLLEKIGYILSILLLMLFLFKVMGSQKWHIAIISTILCTLFVYAIFVLGLKSQLPRGILPF